MLSLSLFALLKLYCCCCSSAHNLPGLKDSPLSCQLVSCSKLHLESFEESLLRLTRDKGDKGKNKQISADFDALSCPGSQCWVLLSTVEDHLSGPSSISPFCVFRWRHCHHFFFFCSRCFTAPPVSPWSIQTSQLFVSCLMQWRLFNLQLRRCCCKSLRCHLRRLVRLEKKMPWITRFHFYFVHTHLSFRQKKNCST